MPTPSPAGNASSRVRNWTGPALLCYGYRPFFLAASLWAVLAMILWLIEMAGVPVLPTAFDPISWHVHEMMFGYLGAALAGFLLTAVPNWTGRLPVLGWPLAALVATWALGRGAVAISDYLPVLLTGTLDLIFPVLLLALVLREVSAGRSGKNIPLLVLFSVYILGNLLFHIEAATGGFPARGLGVRLALSAALMLISLVGGRVIPSFTRNWLVKKGRDVLPAAMGRFDVAVLVITAVALGGWSIAPHTAANAPLLLLAGAVGLIRLIRWKGWSVRKEPLLAILHLGYLFVPIGFLAMSVSVINPRVLPYAGALHLWMAGGIGVMTVAIMSRASLAHAGLPLTAGRLVSVAYMLILAAVGLRFLGAFPRVFLVSGQGMNYLSALCWGAGFSVFTWRYWPIWGQRPVAKRL